MKELLMLMTASLFVILSLVTTVFADDADVLQKRLNLVKSFYASLTQQVTSMDGRVIQEAKGELWVKQPNLFHWHIISPEESMLISDGKTLWFYNPFIEQAIANWLKNATVNTPLMLIINNSDTYWSQYKVKQQGDNFSIFYKLSQSNHSNSNVSKFTINITENGTINSFAAMEQNGQCNFYRLNSKKNFPVDNNKFTFILPEGVTLDDQRQ